MTTEWSSKSLTFGAYRRQWPHGRIIEKKKGEKLVGKEVHYRILQRARRNPKFRHELFEHTRFVWAIAIEEGLGIKAEQFLGAVAVVELHQETAAVLYLRIPACHGGCRAPDLTPAPESEAGSKCHVCGKTLEPQVGAGFAGGPVTRALIEDRIRNRAAIEPAFRQELLQRPLETYVNYARELAGGQTPTYVIPMRQLVVLQERPNEIHLVLPQPDSAAK